MTFYDGFTDELEKIALRGPSLGRILSRSGILAGTTVRAKGFRKKVARTLQERRKRSRGEARHLLDIYRGAYR